MPIKSSAQTTASDKSKRKGREQNKVDFDSAYVVQHLACLPCGNIDIESATVATELGDTSRLSNGSVPWSSPMAKAIILKQATLLGNDDDYSNQETPRRQEQRQQQRKQQKKKKPAPPKLRSKSQGVELCVFFGSKKGCRNADCRFLHSDAVP